MKAGSGGTSADKAKVESMSLDQLNEWIRRMRVGWEHSGTSQGRRSFFKQLVWLEAERERLHGVPSPQRRYNRR